MVGVFSHTVPENAQTLLPGKAEKSSGLEMSIIDPQQL